MGLADLPNTYHTYIFTILQYIHQISHHHIQLTPHITNKFTNNYNYRGFQLQSTK